MASNASTIARMQREIDRLKAAVGERAKELTKRDKELYELWLEVHGKDPEKKTNAFGPAAQSALTRARKAGLDQDDMEKVIRTHARFRFLVFGKWAAKGSDKDCKDKLSDAFKNEDRWGMLLELADSPAPHVSHKPDYEAHFNTLGQDRPLMNMYYALERDERNPYLSGDGQGSAHCPIHDDRERSFRFKEKADGGVVVYCFACSPAFVSNQAFCETVRQDLQIPVTDLYPKGPA